MLIPKNTHNLKVLYLTLLLLLYIIAVDILIVHIL